MRILFSPIGTADPLTAQGDGPMLHLVRHFRPDKVALYLSSDMTENENKDQRYSRAINLLAELLSIREESYTPEIEFIYSEIEEIYHYDLCVDEFEKVLKRVREENPDAEIIVNTSSGTPAMGNALVALGVFGHVGLHAFQVTTPTKGINDPGDKSGGTKEFDLDEYWEYYLDLLEAGLLNEDRCIPVGSKQLNDLLLRDNIRTLVEKYDYVGASQLAAQSETISQEAKKLIDGCVARMNLDVNAANYFSFLKGTDLAYDPSQKLREYLCVLEVYLEREQWADYVRAMTPALFETVCAYIDKYMNEYHPGVEWLLRENKNRLNTDAVRKISSFQQVFDENCLQGRPFFVMNRDLVELIKNMYPENDKSRKRIEQLRSFEENSRNSLSHAICRAEKQWLEKKGDMKLEDSLDLLFDLNNVESGLYKHINDKIIELLYQ